jgi:hypothetical protein
VPVLARRRHEIGEPVEELKRREVDDAVGARPCGLPPACVHRKPFVLSSEHVGGSIGVEKPLHPEPPHAPASYAFDEGCEVRSRDRPRREKLRAAAVGTLREHAVGHARMEVDVALDRRAETVQEGDGAQAWLRRRRGIISTCGASRFAEQPFDLAEKDPRRGRDGLGPVGKASSEPLWHRNHPLPDGYRGNEAIDKMRSCLRHPAAVVGGTDAAALAREGHDKTLPA